MINRKGTALCPVCRGGHLRRHAEAVVFHQWTDKGLIGCTATVLVAVCDGCRFRGWDDEAEPIMTEALRREYDKPPRPGP